MSPRNSSSPHPDSGIWEESTVQVNGNRLRVASTGHGPPLLLVMGIGGNLDMWRPLATRLSGRRLIAFDAPGTGRSDIGPLRRMGGLADLAAGVLDHFAVPEADVLGYSFGGALVQELAHRHPERIRKLVLGATMCGIGGIPGRPDVVFHLSQPFRYRSERYLRWVSPTIYGGQARIKRPGFDTVADEHMAARLGNPPSLAGYLSQLYAISWWSSLPWLHTLPMPVLVLAGDDDPIIPLVNARILAARIPRSELFVVRGGGHLFLIDQTIDVLGALEGFLDAETAGTDRGPQGSASSGFASARAIAR